MSYETWENRKCDKAHTTSPSSYYILDQHDRFRFISDLPAIPTKTKISLTIWRLLKPSVCLGRCFLGFSPGKLLPLYIKKKSEAQTPGMFPRSKATLNNDLAARIPIHLRSRKHTFIKHRLRLKMFGRFWGETHGLSSKCSHLLSRRSQVYTVPLCIPC